MSIFHISVLWSCRTLSEGSHCFQPARRPYRIRVAARGAGRWCLWPSTVRWRTPSCRPTPRCHCFVLLSWNPVRWACDGLHKQKKWEGNATFVSERYNYRDISFDTYPSVDTPALMTEITCDMSGCYLMSNTRCFTCFKWQRAERPSGPTLDTTNIFAHSRHGQAHAMLQKHNMSLKLTVNTPEN